MTKPNFDFSGRCCRWIEGDPQTDGRQCTARPRPGGPWCDEHHRLAYRPARDAAGDDAADPWAKVPAVFAPEVEAA